MQAAELETILLAEDIAKRVQLCCLSCRRRLAGVSLADEFSAGGQGAVGTSISLLSEDLRDFHQSRENLVLTCGCGARSTYYLL